MFNFFDLLSGLGNSGGGVDLGSLLDEILRKKKRSPFAFNVDYGNELKDILTPYSPKLPIIPEPSPAEKVLAIHEKVSPFIPPILSSLSRREFGFSPDQFMNTIANPALERSIEPMDYWKKEFEGAMSSGLGKMMSGQKYAMNDMEKMAVEKFFGKQMDWGLPKETEGDVLSKMYDVYTKQGPEALANLFKTGQFTPNALAVSSHENIRKMFPGVFPEEPKAPKEPKESEITRVRQINYLIKSGKAKTRQEAEDIINEKSVYGVSEIRPDEKKQTQIDFLMRSGMAPDSAAAADTLTKMGIFGKPRASESDILMDEIMKGLGGTPTDTTSGLRLNAPPTTTKTPKDIYNECRAGGGTPEQCKIKAGIQ